MEKLVCSSAQFAETVEKAINDGGCVPLVVTGNSMNPFLKDGKDVVWLKKCGESDFKRGKILLFKRENGALVLHRVRNVLSDGELLMNGDAQYWSEKISKSRVIAVVTQVERNGQKKPCGSNTLWHVLKPFRPLIMRVWRKLKKD